MKKSVFAFALSLLVFTAIFPASAIGENISIKKGGTKVSIPEGSYTGVVFRATVSGIGFSEVNTSEGFFTLLNIKEFGLRNAEGEPALPVYRKLIEVPLGATYSVRIRHSHITEIDLGQHGVRFPVFPAQPPLSKSDDPDKVPFIINKVLYNTDRYIEDELVTVTNIGLMRALNLARVDISPVQYNPVTRMLKIYDDLEIEIVFENADIQGTEELKLSKASPYFISTYKMAANYRSPGPEDALITSAPATYVIVSDPMFQSALQPFIQWKVKKGFNVIQAYTSNPAVGTTTTSIKTYLQNLYNTPPDGYAAPSFVLFVGDVAQIPAWSGSAGSHVTDLRYCEYTGDNLPEVFYGRFSANNPAQLQPQIDKTLEYEQYLMPDPSFLGEVVMVAGADAGHQTWSNGQINYGTETYFNAAHNILSHTYLQPEPSGGNYSQQIRNNVSDGVAYGNYTAHCSSSGWADPSFTTAHIPALTNQGKYGLLVGNCCQSATFDGTCFAEEILRAENKGAVGYIGGSNSTYWDEDFWWGCGFKTVALNPVYDGNHIGAYDGTFHDHGEPTDDWFVTQGQMVVCGNYAVEESNSGMKTYYWEIYHLMGDPSLMIYYSVPPPLSATYLNTLMIGMNSLTVTTEAYATVALSGNGVLLDAKVTGLSGSVTLNFSPLSAPGNLDIVITKQNRQPHTGTIQVIPAEGPYIVYTGNTINDPPPSGNNNGVMDYDETNLLSVDLKNVGVETAGNVVATLSSGSTFITITDNNAVYGNIAPDQTVSVPDGFLVNVANNIPDQQVVAFTISATDGTDTWNSNFNITANAPLLTIGAMTVTDNGPGCNNDGILDPGETADLVIACSNNGHSAISNVNGLLEIAGGASPYLTLNSTSYSLGSLSIGGTASAIFNVTAEASVPLGTPVDLLFTLSGGAASQYSVQETKQVIIGLIPEYNMADASITTCTGYFYDSGGAAAPYGDSEDLTMTIYPATAGNLIRLEFSAFYTESGYDFLSIYNGTSTSAPLMGTWNGTSGPGTITANNSPGALTINFTSDGSVTRDGWVASISCYNPAQPPVAEFSASTSSPALNSVVIFSDLSENVPTSWVWSFSPADVTFVNGTTENSQNPEVLFSNLGFYSVTLTVTNAYGSDTKVKANYINVVNCTYCETSYSNLSDDFISNVQLNTINNASGSTSYSDFTSIATELTPGTTYPVSVSVTVNGSWTQHCIIWTDWNNNCIFTDAGEAVDLGQTPGTQGTHILTGNITVPANVPPGTYRIRIAERFSTDPGPCDQTTYGEAEDYTIIIPALNKTLNLTVFLESLYNGSGTMRKARNAGGDQYPGNTADQITVELHNSLNYSDIVYTEPFVSLSTTGEAVVEIPANLNGSYYITIKHRNSLATTSKLPVSFGTDIIDYSFDGPTQAYGNNMLLMTDGHCAIFGGDVNQDGSVDTADMTPVDNDASDFATGYLVTDVNGDGTVDTGDMTIIDNNAATFTGTVTP
ncbi:protein containing PKD repeat [Lentimicrobium saccharophilum]|uniref:Protein containing PKD repeat n=1 Tax=Lentimicrobium saccharophilum TaxID=1678841 RepID=A0A0S7BXS8_9BACT|nr:C25 family cysteine peptidase [Lentimicrobium saccharophilum]GAP42401.1 protein containing PKD repeat [Lentimicrobium saccharophilum]